MEQLSDEWFAARKGKVTASNAAALLGMVAWTPVEEAFKRMHGTAAPVENAACDWGRKHEATALGTYKRQRPWCEIQLSGLHVHPKYSWLAGSPDALVSTYGCLEIKCPFWRRKNQDRAMPHEKVPDYYYVQTQIVMACTDRVWCDFISWTPSSMTVTTILRDDQLLSTLISLLQPLSEMSIDTPVFELRSYARKVRHAAIAAVEDSMSFKLGTTVTYELDAQNELLSSDPNYERNDSGQLVCTAFVQALARGLGAASDCLSTVNGKAKQ